jgi:XTP/dITP diphosphohydrolase
VEKVKATLASQNAHKLAELRAILPGWELDALAADGWPEETGATYEANARIKAAFARGLVADGWVLGEDSGIECDALGGEPGLHSARWAPAGSQADALLERLAGEPDRRARMVASIVAIGPDGDELTSAHELGGTIAAERRGETGFGYDPVFVPDGLTQTVAELGEGWKHEQSHRAKAARALAAALAGRGSG